MTNKEKFSTRMLKRFYGVQGELDEYRRNEIYKIGNTAFIAMFYYSLISNFLVFLILSLDEYKHLESIFLWYIWANIIFVVFGISGYIIFATKSRHLVENEVQDIAYQKKRLINISIKQGFTFGVLTFILNGIMSPHLSELTSWHTVRVYIIECAFFGLAMYFYQRMDLKKLKE
ncbi:DUF3278 domain-containing protein [Leuconostoc mesenteroides]|uniref:DUF3278 domain-containing protein n=1 Tax=Leuconostoc mesenteroides TaxID=1245 RepID=UPI001CBB7D62|nr:DUF3278 domain-containing protein [Leuconostoc mesenteroides]MBZ1517264.1 DUF3278 domain-containing protein [Leuconostoc mesenteroides]MBZ1541386.1 DUF3278 domain-containing protein [Leuconostoc mesenteroides]